MNPTPPFAVFGPHEIRAAVGFPELVDPVARALAAFSEGQGEAPAMVFAPAGALGDVHVKAAWLPGRAHFIVKIGAWFAVRAASGVSPGSGMIGVFDARTGDLRALLEDEHHLSDIRTAAAGAVAAERMARPDARVLGVLGTAAQAYLQALAAAQVRPIAEIRVWGRDPARARRLAQALRLRRPGLEVVFAPCARAAVEGADIVVTATSSREPLLQAGWLSPGAHVTAVGADDFEKWELDPQVLRRADRLVVDSRALALRYGDVARAAALGMIDAGCIDAELGDVASGRAPGRRDAREITVCKLIGLGVQDLAAAEVALERLRDPSLSKPRPASAADLRGAAGLEAS